MATALSNTAQNKTRQKHPKYRATPVAFTTCDAFTKTPCFLYIMASCLFTSFWEVPNLLLHLLSCFYHHISFPCERGCCFLKLSLKPSGLLRRWRRKRRCYSSHPPVTPYACMCHRCCIWAGFKRVIQLQLFEDALCHLPVVFAHVYLQVRELYKGALGKLQQLHPFLVMQGTLGEGDGRIRMEVEKEAVRRKNLGSQLKSLLDRQLEVTFPLLL